MAWGNAEHLAVEQKLLDEFMKCHPNVKVKLVMVPISTYHQKLQIMLASRTAPDVMKVDLYYFPALVRKDYFLCIEPFANTDPEFDINDFFDQPLEECRYQGKLYGLNVAFGGHMIYFNKTLFKKTGIPDPYTLSKRGEWTLDKYLEVCKKLTKFDKNGKPLQFGSNLPHHWYAIWSFGGEILSPDCKRCLIDSPQAIQGLQFMQDLRWKHHVVARQSESTMDAFAFESGRVGMIYAWSGHSPILLSKVRNFEWDVAPVPAGPAGRVTPLKGNQLCIFSESQHPKEAWELIKFITSAKNEMFMCGKLRRSLTTHKSVAADPRYYEHVTPPANTRVFTDQMEYGRRIPINERYFQWFVEFQAGLERIHTNEVDAKTAVEEMVPRINRALQEEEW